MSFRFSNCLKNYSCFSDHLLYFLSFQCLYVFVACISKTLCYCVLSSLLMTGVGWNAGCEKCESIDTLSERGILTMGPARRVAENPFLIIVGRYSGSVLLLYISENCLTWVNIEFFSLETVRYYRYYAPVLRFLESNKQNWIPLNCDQIWNFAAR